MKPRGRPRKDRVRKVVYLDPPIAEAIDAQADGERGASDTINSLLTEALRPTRRQAKR